MNRNGAHAMFTTIAMLEARNGLDEPTFVTVREFRTHDGVQQIVTRLDDDGKVYCAACCMIGTDIFPDKDGMYVSRYVVDSGVGFGVGLCRRCTNEWSQK